MNEQNQQTTKKPNKFVAVLKRIFVHNIGWKILSVVSAAIIWALAAGLL